MKRKKEAERKEGRSTVVAPTPAPTRVQAALQSGHDASTAPAPKEKKPSGFSMLLLHRLDFQRRAAGFGWLQQFGHAGA